MIGYYNLSVNNDRIEVKSEGLTSVRVITDIQYYIRFFTSEAERIGCDIDDLTVMCSSSMDWPEDSTKNKETIALANEIRGNSEN